MLANWLFAGALVALLGATGYSQTGALAPVAPRLLSETGLYAGEGTRVVDVRNRPFAPQYPLPADQMGAVEPARVGSGCVPMRR